MNNNSKTGSNHAIRNYLAEIGGRGGRASRRYLSPQHARRMAAIREWKRATIKAGKPWPPVDKKSRRLLKLSSKHGEPTKTRAYRAQLTPEERIRIPGWY